MPSCTSTNSTSTVRNYQDLHKTTPRMSNDDSDNETLFKEVRRFIRDYSSGVTSTYEVTRPEPPSGRVPKSLGDFDLFLTPSNVEIALGELSDSISECSAKHSRTSISSPDSAKPEVPVAQLVKQNVAKAVRWDLLPAAINSPIKARRSSANLASTNVNFRLESSEIHPKYILTVSEQISKIITKLVQIFGSGLNAQLIEASYMLGNVTGKTGSGGIHVFVDISNIEIGFYDRLKANRNIEKNTMKKAAPFSFPLFTLILERGRTTSKRILAGSISHQFSASQHLPAHIIHAEKCGYEVNILERVYKPQDVRRMKRAHRARYSTTSGNSSASESASSQPYVTKEQAVDEILHLKMCQSMVDQINRNEKPTTMVIASGDSAPAEFSDGFLRNIERALSAGWNVEVIAWTDGLGRDYRTKKFLDKWADKFMIIELDDFAEELLASYARDI